MYSDVPDRARVPAASGASRGAEGVPRRTGGVRRRRSHDGRLEDPDKMLDKTQKRTLL
jgi:hypothetical protein